MPAVVKCPNGCKLRVPARKLFDTFPCPKCSASLFVSKDQIDLHEAEPNVVLHANLSSDLVEVVSDDIIFLEGESSHLLVEVIEESEELLSSGSQTPEPPPVVDQQPSDQVFADEADRHLIDSEILHPETISHSNLMVPANQSLAETSMAEVDKSLEDEETEINRLEKKLAQAQKDRQGGTPFFSKWFEHPDNPGVVQNKQNRWKAYSLSWAMVIIGIFLFGPVAYTMIQWIGKDYHLPLGRWSYLLIFFSAFQFLYALFLFQIPDWTTTRFVSYLMLVMTMFSTCMLAVALLSQESNNFFNFLQLSIVNKGQVCGWLTVMSIGFGLMSYLCGRTTQLWIKEESRRLRVT